MYLNIRVYSSYLTKRTKFSVLSIESMGPLKGSFKDGTLSRNI